MNLMLNALEAAGKEGQVRVEIVVDGATLVLRVLDTGPGLAPQMAQCLGEAFATTKPEGVGLGLAVARQVAEVHGGRIRSCRMEDMTCFELSLPIGAGEPEGTGAAVAAPEPVAVNHNP